jgi:hydrogenase expression/formation protein HypC
LFFEVFYFPTPDISGKEFTMCLAIPAEVEKLFPEREEALVNMGGVRKPISTALLDEVMVGDYVIVHVGFALSRINPKEAEETIRLMLQQAANEDIPASVAA